MRVEAESRITVAINAQINPDTAGGVESSALSIMRYYAGQPDSVRLNVLALPSHHDRFQEIVGPHHGVQIWTAGQERPISAVIGNRYVRFLREATGPLGPLVEKVVVARRMRQLHRTLGTAAANDRALKSAGAQIVHFTYGSTFPTALPYVYEPHDIQHRHYPEFFDPREVAWRDRVYGDGCRGAAMCVCGSQWTKNDIVSQFGVPPERVAVIPRSSYNARIPVSEARRREILDELALPERFAYYPAMTFPHKNHRRLFEALARLRDERRIILPLVMSGRWHKPSRAALERALDELRLRDQVRMLAVVPEETLSVLFQSAWFMVFPSLFEGLSQSLLEGLHAGLPIVAAHQTSIPETVGNGAVLFDGLDVGSIAEALHGAVSDEALLRAVASRGRIQYARYSWSKAGPMLTAVYRHILGRPLAEHDQALVGEATGRAP